MTVPIAPIESLKMGRPGGGCLKQVLKQLMTESTLKVAPTDRQARQTLLELVGSVGGDPSLADFEVGEIGEAPEMHQPRISDVCLAELERCEAGQPLQVRGAPGRRPLCR